MRPWILTLATGVILHAQSTSMAEADRARLDVSRLEELVREGVVARNRLDQAKTSLADAADDAILRRTLYGTLTVQDLDGAQIEEMIAAAQRRLDRVQAKVDARKELVEHGVVARTELTPDLEELEIRRRTLDLAQARKQTFEGLLELLRAEEEAEARALEALEEIAAPVWRPAERYDGSGRFRISMLGTIESAFARRFEKPLPVSALGMTELHRSMGFDHRERVDIALAPDSAEGIWLRRYLEQEHIPYFAFRSFVPGSATAPHIHIGPPSLRLPRSASGN